MRIACAAIALIAWSGCAFAQKYVISELRQLPEVGGGFNGEIGNPAAINDKGQIVGFAYLNGVLIPHAMIWNGTKPTDLGTLGGSSSIAKGINDKGQVVGWAETSDGHNHATIWNGTTPSDLGTLGGPFSEATAINDAGEVVGDSSLSLSPDVDAAIWNSKMPADHIDLGTLGGGFSLASGINAAGQVVGYSFTSGGFSVQAVIWQASLVTGVINVTQLHPLGGNNAFGVAINNSGQVAGFSSIAGGNFHAALWRGLDPIDLGTLGTLPISTVYGLNDKGQVVGTSFAPIGTISAVLWQDGTVVDLNTLVSGPIVANRTLNQAIAINNKGVITGRGTDNSSGASFMFVLTPVAQALAELLTEVTGVGPGRSLAHKVKLAEAYYSAHDIEATCAELAGLNHEVKTLAGKRIDRTLAKQVITDARAIETAIGCEAAECKLEKDDDHDKDDVKDHDESHCHGHDDGAEEDG